MAKEATIVVKVESELKSFLDSIAETKGVTLSEYTRFVIGRGLDAIAKRNREIRALEAQLQLQK